MSPHHRGAPRHTGLAIAGVVAIPFASVTAAAWLGDAASSTDPREAIAGLAALAGGLVMGLLVRRLVTTVDRQVRGVARLLVAVARRIDQSLVDLVAAGSRVAAIVVPLPQPAFVPAEVGRRGPPVRVR